MLLRINLEMKQLVLSIFLLSLCTVSISPAEELKQGRITGRMMIKDGGPMSDGAVLIYDAAGPLPLPDKYFRVPDNVAFIDEEGKFSHEIASGTYFIGGMKKKAGKGPGPPKEGDFFFIIQEPGGMPKAFVVDEIETLDIGTISEGVPYKISIDREGVTAIEGTVLNGKGAPVEGVVVFADVTPAKDRGISFVSGWTGKDGKYFLRVHGGGTYNLSATDFLGSRGIYGEESTEPVSVKTGEVLKGIDLIIGKSDN